MKELVLVLCCLPVVFGVWFLNPPVADPGKADVIIVLAGQTDGRHELGAQLAEAGVAENVVVSNPLGIRDLRGSSFCRGSQRPQDVNTRCMSPQPVTTAGEAMTLNQLAAAEGWRSAVIVTNRPHNYRVRTIFKECTDLDTTVVSVDWIDPNRILYHVAREIGGFAKHWLTNPCKGIS